MTPDNIRRLDEDEESDPIPLFFSIPPPAVFNPRAKLSSKAVWIMYLSHCILNILLLGLGANMVNAVIYCSNSGVSIIPKPPSSPSLHPFLFLYISYLYSTKSFDLLNHLCSLKPHIAEENAQGVVAILIASTHMYGDFFFKDGLENSNAIQIRTRTDILRKQCAQDNSKSVGKCVCNCKYGKEWNWFSGDSSCSPPESGTRLVELASSQWVRLELDKIGLDWRWIGKKVTWGTLLAYEIDSVGK